jgi:hypothetical protein
LKRFAQLVDSMFIDILQRNEVQVAFLGELTQLTRLIRMEADQGMIQEVLITKALVLLLAAVKCLATGEGSVHASP